MRNNRNFSNLIYDYFVTRIRFQYYKEGDQLPIIDTLCREFCVADQTVRSALRRLRAEGYITMHNGQPTTVIFRQSEKEYDDYLLRYYEERQDAFFDLCQTVELIFIPLLIEGFGRIDEDDFSALINFAKNADVDDFVRFYCYILQKLDNPLTMNLFWEIILFQGFPLLKTRDRPGLNEIDYVRNQLYQVVAFIREQNFDEFKINLLSYQRAVIGNAVGYIKRRVKSVPIHNQISFTWRIYRDHPQICYSLTSHLLHDIYMGDYSSLEYLPSYEKMADKYSVSVSTIRRTVRVLNELGVARSVNGKGTLIYTMEIQNDPPDFTATMIRRNLAYFFQAFEILLFSCEEIIKSTLSSLTGEERKEFTEHLRENSQKGRYDRTLWLIMICIIYHTSFHGIREIYKKIYGLFLWGYPLGTCVNRNLILQPAERRLTETLIDCFERNDIDLCAGVVKKFACQLFPITEAFLLSKGFKPEELRTSPAIRFLALDDG